MKENNIPPKNILHISFDNLNDFIEFNIDEMVEIYSP